MPSPLCVSRRRRAPLLLPRPLASAAACGPHAAGRLRRGPQRRLPHALLRFKLSCCRRVPQRLHACRAPCTPSPPRMPARRRGRELAAAAHAADAAEALRLARSSAARARRCRSWLASVAGGARLAGCAARRAAQHAGRRGRAHRQALPGMPATSPPRALRHAATSVSWRRALRWLRSAAWRADGWLGAGRRRAPPARVGGGCVAPSRDAGSWARRHSCGLRGGAPRAQPAHAAGAGTERAHWLSGARDVMPTPAAYRPAPRASSVPSRPQGDAAAARAAAAASLSREGRAPNNMSLHAAVLSAGRPPRRRGGSSCRLPVRAAPAGGRQLPPRRRGCRPPGGSPGGGGRRGGCGLRPRWRRDAACESSTAACAEQQLRLFG